MAKVPENAQELFNVQVPEALSKFPDKARKIGAGYLFKIAGDGGGTWTVDLTANPPAVTQGDKGNAQCTFEVQHEWPQLPDKYTWQTTHNVAVDKSGNLYVIHEGRTNLKDHPSIFVFDPEGKYIRSFGAQSVRSI